MVAREYMLMESQHVSLHACPDITGRLHVQFLNECKYIDHN